MIADDLKVIDTTDLHELDVDLQEVELGGNQLSRAFWGPDQAGQLHGRPRN